MEPIPMEGVQSELYERRVLSTRTIGLLARDISSYCESPTGLICAASEICMIPFLGECTRDTVGHEHFRASWPYALGHIRLKGTYPVCRYDAMLSEQRGASGAEGSANGHRSGPAQVPRPEDRPQTPGNGITVSTSAT